MDFALLMCTFRPERSAARRARRSMRGRTRRRLRRGMIVFCASPLGDAELPALNFPLLPLSFIIQYFCGSYMAWMDAGVPCYRSIQQDKERVRLMHFSLSGQAIHLRARMER